MKRPTGYQNHQCAPKGWRGTPILTGDPDYDASIMHCPNKDAAGKLQMHLVQKKRPYGHKNAYNAYEQSND